RDSWCAGKHRSGCCCNTGRCRERSSGCHCCSRRGTSCRSWGWCRPLADHLDSIYPPALIRSTAISAHAPPQHAGMSAGYAHCRRNEATRTACPRLATSQGITTAGVDGAIVTALQKAAASAKDVLECPTVDADLQNATVKRVLKRIIVAESENGTCKRINRNRRRIEVLVADHSWIIDPCRSWRRVGWRHRKPGIRCLPEYPVGIDDVVCYAARRDDWPRYI